VRSADRNRRDHTARLGAGISFRQTSHGTVSGPDASVHTGRDLGAVLGLPAAIRALRLWKQGLSFHQDEAANDERFVG
jgi:hypothetical protein